MANFQSLVMFFAADLVFAISIFSSSSTSIVRDSSMRLGFGMEVVGNLIESVDLDFGMGVGMDADGVVNFVSSYFLDTYP